ncbi:RNA-binding domain-containing protein [Didymella exigua CBS 183.55]|uniref:RNA-binding domain-containing protein n=1 Tax=Didymella exigua CBS 183.55 TaxID=1150837 RepID=A0A6A5RA25_9PLEO|nr:RNA-binding domain-containing protein [Didymella exigua CBS 183.55]KAF1924373.1 RNA-binding domain-containing protein [Didymella exigua CBS 183.55]
MATQARGPPGTVPVSKEGVPNRTLYVRNLNDKLPKEDLKRNLYMLFATYGVILDIVALKTMKMRGQAHVVFRDVDSSTQAMRALQGFTFFGKDMQIAYAKSKSDTVAKLDGTYKMPEPDLPEKAAEETSAQPTGFSAALEKAVPVNEQDRAKGQKRKAEEEDEEEEDDDDAEMEMDSDSD